MQVWVLREHFIAYERLHGIYETKEKAKARYPDANWQPIIRKVDKPMWDDTDPFDSALGAESVKVGTSLWVVDPQDVR